MDPQDKIGLTELTADIVSAFIGSNTVRPEDVGSLIADVHKALTQASLGTAAPAAEAPQPAVPIKKSVMPDYIVSLENGQKFKSMKRHLKTTYGLTPNEYRAKWGLPGDYPMVAPNYSRVRSELAKSRGLGRKTPVSPDEETVAPVAKRSRRAPAIA